MLEIAGADLRLEHPHLLHGDKLLSDTLLSGTNVGYTKKNDENNGKRVSQKETVDQRQLQTNSGADLHTLRIGPIKIGIIEVWDSIKADAGAPRRKLQIAAPLFIFFNLLLDVNVITPACFRTRSHCEPSGLARTRRARETQRRPGPLSTARGWGWPLYKLYYPYINKVTANPTKVNY